MSVFRASNYISWMMLILLPASLPAADARSALLHSRGGVWVNGDEVADSITVFAGDSIETKPGFVANLDVDGSSVLIRPESIVKFAGEYLVLEHGSVAVGTSTLLSVHINCLRVDPVTAARTQYEVVDVSGRVEVAARRSDVRIRQSGGSERAPPRTTPGNRAWCMRAGRTRDRNRPRAER